MADLRTTAINPNAPVRRDQLPQMTATPRSPRMGMLADALMAARNFANRLQVPQGVPLIGGEGLGSLVLGRAPEELVEMSYGNMPMRINPYAGRTASFVPEMKPNRGAQVADLLSLAGVPGGGRTAASMVGGGMADFGAGAERALIGYHGTPHRFAPTPANPLGEFRASQIGTGEGAQAFGHGLYFAEAPGVAKGYQTALSGYSADGKRLPSDIGMIVSNYGGDVTAAIADKQRQIDKWLAREDRLSERVATNVVKGLQDDIKKLSALQGKRLESTGSLYTVDIPDEMIGKMLDWDRPLSQQPNAIQETIDRILRSDVLDADTKKLIGGKDIKASKFYEAMASSDTFAGQGTFGAAASDYLRRQGIPGIRYLDQGSRGAGDGTRNIVVFPGEEQNVKILSRE